MGNLDKNESLTKKEEAVSDLAAAQCDNFVSMETDDLMDDGLLDDADIEATLAENIVDYGIFAPDPLTMEGEHEDTALLAQDAIKTEKVEEGEITRPADGGFVERQNGPEDKVSSAVKSILKAEFEDEEENYNDKSSSSLS